MSKYSFIFIFLMGSLGFPHFATGQSLSSDVLKNIGEYNLSENYKQLPLQYGFNALEPYIDAATMEIHYTKHHAGYVTNLNKALEGQPWAKKPLLELFQEIDQLPAAVRNHGGGHYNHQIFWQMLKPNGGGEATGPIADGISKGFGSFENFRKEFSAKALSRFGSGWVWLSVDRDGKLFISNTANQDNPLMNTEKQQGIPLLALDVWEHAYYLKYQNKRPDYVEAFWKVINWDEVNRRYLEAMKSLGK